MNQINLTIKEAVDNLLPAASFAASEKSSLPIHNFVLIKNQSGFIFAIATNGAQTLTRRVAQYIGEDFQLCVDGQKLQAIISGLKTVDNQKPMVISWENLDATIKVGRSKLVLGMINPDTFPSPNRLSNSYDCTFKASALLDCVNSVVHAVGVRNAHSFFNGVNIRIDAGVLSVISSDGHRLSRSVCNDTINDTGSSINAILPRRYISLLSMIPKNENIRLRIDASMAEITWIDGLIRTSLIDAEFPDTRGHFDSSSVNAFSTSRESLLLALARLNATVEERRPALKLNSASGELQLTTLSEQNKVTGEDFIGASIGSDFSVCINLKYLQDALNAFPDEQISVQLSDLQGFIAIKGSTSSMTELIAPMRV